VLWVEEEAWIGGLKVFVLAADKVFGTPRRGRRFSKVMSRWVKIVVVR
jgi:hypothetical protein